MSKGRREQLAAIEQAALELSPEALAVAADLMRHRLDDRVRTRCLEVLLSYGMGRPREIPVAAETVEPTHTQVNVHFVTASPPPKEPAGPIIDATLEPPVSVPAPQDHQTASDTCAEIARVSAELAREKARLPVQDPNGFAGRRRR